MSDETTGAGRAPDWGRVTVHAERVAWLQDGLAAVIEQETDFAVPVAFGAVECPAEDVLTGYQCCMPRGHAGPHVGWDGLGGVRVWRDRPEVAPRPPPPPPPPNREEHTLRMPPRGGEGERPAMPARVETLAAMAGRLGDFLCLACSRNGAFCDLPPGHDGPHFAVRNVGGRAAVEQWVDAPEAPPRNGCGARFGGDPALACSLEDGHEGAHAVEVGGLWHTWGGKDGAA